MQETYEEDIENLSRSTLPRRATICLPDIQSYKKERDLEFDSLDKMISPNTSSRSEDSSLPPIKPEMKNSSWSKYFKQGPKALDWLGIDPSKEKIIRMLGISKDRLDSIQQERFESEINAIRKKQSLIPLQTIKNNPKAAELLGIDPQEKPKKLLGINESQDSNSGIT